MPSRGDIEFGEQAVTREFLSDRVVQLYLQKLDAVVRQGRILSIDRLFLADRILSVDQVIELQTDLKRRIQFCSTCGIRHNVFGIDPGRKVRCKKCDHHFWVDDVAELSCLEAVGGGTGSPGAGRNDTRDDELIFGCPECGADLLLDDDFCPHCAEAREE